MKSKDALFVEELRNNRALRQALREYSSKAADSALRKQEIASVLELIQDSYGICRAALENGALFDMPRTERKFREVAANMIKAEKHLKALQAV